MGGKPKNSTSFSTAPYMYDPIPHKEYNARLLKKQHSEKCVTTAPFKVSSKMIIGTKSRNVNYSPTLKTELDISMSEAKLAGNKSMEEANIYQHKFKFRPAKSTGKGTIGKFPLHMAEPDAGKIRLNQTDAT